MDVTTFNRRELKYLISATQRAALGDVLGARLRPDPHGDAAGNYATVDVYYDNDAYDIYWERRRRLPSRRKLRVRVYGGVETGATGAYFVEIKLRQDGRVAKRRVRLALDEALAVCRGDAPPRRLARADRAVALEARDFVRARQLAPVCVVRCERQAFVGQASEVGLRVTFDQRIRYRLRELVPRPDDRDMDGEVLGDDPCLLEIKVDGDMPDWLSELLAAQHCELRSHSKYCRALEAAGGVPPSPTPVHAIHNGATERLPMAECTPCG